MATLYAPSICDVKDDVEVSYKRSYIFIGPFLLVFHRYVFCPSNAATYIFPLFVCSGND